MFVYLSNFKNLKTCLGLPKIRNGAESYEKYVTRLSEYCE